MRLRLDVVVLLDLLLWLGLGKERGRYGSELLAVNLKTERRGVEGAFKG